MSSVIFGHGDKENDPKIVLLAFALQMNLRKPSNIVDPSHPILPFEDVDWVFCQSEKG